MAREDVSIIKKETLKGIADAIRYIEDSSDEIKVSDYADRLIASKQATYGVRFYGSAVNGTRLYDAVGKRSGINGATNDFDAMPIYKDIQPVYLDALDSNGNPLRDSNGNVIKNKMIRIPNFYVKHLLDTDADGNSYDEWRISTKGGRDDWYPCFVDQATGEITDYALVGAYYTTYLDGQTLLGCQKGQNPRVDVSQNSDSLMCYVNHEGTLQRLHCTIDGMIWSAISILFMVEFATRNVQSVMNGVANDEYRRINVNAGETDLNPKNTSVTKLYITNGAGCISGKTVGDTIQIYNGRWNTRTITKLDTTVHSGYTEVSLDKAITTSSDTYVSYSWAEAVGTTDSIASSSGRNLNQTSSKAHFKYRGIEDCWGNLWHINSGWYFKGDGTDEVLYRQTDFRNGSANGVSTGCVLAKSNGYAKVVEMTKDNHGVVLYTKEVGAASNTYYSDYFYQSVASNNHCLLYGGNGHNGANAGAFCFYCNYGFTYAHWNCGLRPSLMFQRG